MTRRVGGFTMIELVVVIVIATVLAAFAASRINTQSFQTEGYANQVAAMMRYAQKIAISQRRVVAVVIASGNVSLCYTDAACSGGAVREPPGTSAFSHAAPSNVSLSGLASFTFSALGKPSASGTLTIQDTDSPPTVKTITVEAESGYVRYAP